MTARDTLDRALIGMAANGQRPRCGDPADTHRWTSDRPDDRRRAAALCRGCPLLAPCTAAADETNEPFGTWGGHDRTRHPHRDHTNQKHGGTR